MRNSDTIRRLVINRFFHKKKVKLERKLTDNSFLTIIIWMANDGCVDAAKAINKQTEEKTNNQFIPSQLT